MKDSPPIPRSLTPSRYHAQSRHAFERYAPGPATLDWEQQPSPYRVYQGAAVVPLARGEPLPDLPFGDLMQREALAPAPLGLPSLGTLLRLALGISAWKRLGEARWAVRCNPSSGNLHPVECYGVQSGFPGLAAGLYHYECESHALEQRCAYDAGLAAALAEVLPPGGLLLGLSLVPWREEWKYGLRAWRYCQLDLGHAIAAFGLCRRLPGLAPEPCARLGSCGPCPASRT
jgi:SagB-type dehydrogenase family enzyme